LVLLKPFPHEPQRSPGQEASEYLPTLDHDQGLVAAVPGVEMRGWVIREVHLDHYPLETR
jgi:hypothetical protein